MFTWFSKKDRKIANLEAMVKNRDILIERKMKYEERLEARIAELERTVVLLTDNLSEAKKKKLGL